MTSSPLNIEQDPVRVAVGILVHEGRVLMARRPAGTHLAGHWEFPGGKILPGETPHAAVQRETLEELAVGCGALRLFHVEEFGYPDRTVELSFFLCSEIDGTPVGREGQEIRWVELAALDALTTPPANERVIRKLQAELGGKTNSR